VFRAVVANMTDSRRADCVLEGWLRLVFLAQARKKAIIIESLSDSTSRGQFVRFDCTSTVCPIRLPLPLATLSDFTMHGQFVCFFVH
jgi:hypothetical protein